MGAVISFPDSKQTESLYDMTKVYGISNDNRIAEFMGRLLCAS